MRLPLDFLLPMGLYNWIIAAAGLENGRLDNFFCMGWGCDEPPTCAAD